MKLKADPKNILNYRCITRVRQVFIRVQKDAHHDPFTARFYEEGFPNFNVTDRHVSEDGLSLFRVAFLHGATCGKRG
jgi:hypothetical protein